MKNVTSAKTTLCKNKHMLRNAVILNTSGKKIIH